MSDEAVQAAETTPEEQDVRLYDNTALAAEMTPAEQQTQQHVYEAALTSFHRRPDWVAFFRDILGLRGVVRRCYRTREALEAFQQTEVYAEIQQMLGQLRRQSNDMNLSQEPTGVITVRMPKSVHDALKAEAYERRTSMNKLCISKLLQFIDNELVPSDFREKGDPEADV